MICILSSAKTFRDQQETLPISPTIPFSLEKTGNLLSVLQKFTTEEMAKQMKISDKLAYENETRYKEWEQTNTGLALHSFDGDAFKAFKKEKLTSENWKNANNHIAILSGLYGILRPTDEIRPYRLEMAIDMREILGENLYDYWQKEITKQLNVMANDTGAEYILNLASKEYSSVLDMKKLAVPLINVEFKNKGPKGLRTIAIHAKRARGRMARFVLDNEIKNPEKIKDFSENRYMFDAGLSTVDNFVFVGE